MRAGIIFLNMANNFSHCWSWVTHLFESKHLSILSSVSAQVVLSSPEMFPHLQKVPYSCMLPVNFILILVVEDKLSPA